jgi:hypothetical protein
MLLQKNSEFAGLLSRNVEKIAISRIEEGIHDSVKRRRDGVGKVASLQLKALEDCALAPEHCPILGHTIRLALMLTLSEMARRTGMRREATRRFRGRVELRDLLKGRYGLAEITIARMQARFTSARDLESGIRSAQRRG